MPLVINFHKFLLEEKKQAILDFARVKLARDGLDGEVIDSDEFQVFRVIATKCDTNVNLNFGKRGKFTQEKILMACKSEGLKIEEKKDKKEDKLEAILGRLSTNAQVFLDRTLIGEQYHYQVNWDHLFEKLQAQIMESIIESTSGLGPYHTRVIRILKSKGYLNETDIQKMCLLPPRDTRAIINQLMKFGYVEYLSVPLGSKP